MTDPLSSDQEVCSYTAYSYRVQELLMKLRFLYEAPEALRWLTSEQSLLSGRAPVDLIQTYGGWKEVEGLIARVSDGAYS